MEKHAMRGGTAILRKVARFLPSVPLRPFGRPVAFFFHGVERRISDPDIQRNHHEREDFYRIAKSLKAEFEVLPLSALPEVLANPVRRKRTAFLMSDDGYRNTMTEAADILDGLGLPWTLFVSTHHIDTGELNPLTAARLFLRFGPEGTHAIPHLGEVALGNADSRRVAARRWIRALHRLDGRRGYEAVRAMISALSRPTLAALTERFASERFLNWKEVAALSERGVAIGAHGHRHWPMHKGCSAADVVEDVRSARQRVEHQIGTCRAFAYPFGTVRDISHTAWQAVRNEGFEYAFTTWAGTLDGGSNPWLLPRCELMPGETGLGALAPLLRAANGRLVGRQRKIA